MRKNLQKFRIVLMSGVYLSLSVPSMASDETYAPIPPIKLKTNQAQVTQKPLLENYATYNEFLYASYLYERGIKESKPDVVIQLPYKAQQTPEVTYSDVDDEPDVTNWGDSIPQKK